jgi:hypothetical protein
MPRPARAIVIIEFVAGNSGGSVAADGNTGSIPIVSLNVFGDSHCGSCFFPVSNGTMAFNAPLGTVAIDGGVPTLGIPSGTALLGGSGPAFTPTFFTFQNIIQRVIIDATMSGGQLQDDTLLTALGLPLGPVSVGEPWMARFFVFGQRFGSNGNFSGSFQASGTGVASLAPEPGAFVLLGFGLILMAATIVSHRRKAAGSGNA